MSDLRCANLVIAARLHSHAHQYMEHMVDNYLCLAKERFEQSKNVSYPHTIVSKIFFICRCTKVSNLISLFLFFK